MYFCKKKRDMKETFFQKQQRLLGKEHSVHRLEVMITHLNKAKETTDTETASVVDDVILVLERTKDDLENGRFSIPPAL